MSQSELLETFRTLDRLESELAGIRSRRAARIAAQPKPEPSPRRRHFKSITQVNLPNRDGDYYALIAICEEGRAWRKYQGERWIEIESLPDI
jgi:hypothetical protein